MLTTIITCGDPVREKSELFYMSIMEIRMRLLYIQEWKRHRLPEIVAVLARHFEVLVKLFFNKWIVLYRNGVPHKIFLDEKILSQ